LVATQLRDGKYSHDTIDEFKVLTGVDRNFAILTTSRFTNISQTAITYIDPANNSTDGPFTIYSSEFEIVDSHCKIFTSLNYNCLFLIQEANGNQFVIKVSFLRSGLVLFLILFFF